jgi:hypothetical protein
VPVRRPGVGVGQAGGQVGARRIGQGPQPERAIDMQPRLMPPGPFTDGGEGVERTGVHFARLGADHHRAGHVPREAIGAHPPLIIGRHPAHPVPPQAQQAQGLDHRGVGLLPDDYGQFRRPEQPVGLHVPASAAPSGATGRSSSSAR